MNAVTIGEPRTVAEIRGMWQLNHDVFSRELHQHELHPDGILVDKFHNKNLYRIALKNGEVIGMVCAHWQPPFSAATRFGAVLTPWLTERKIGEIRLFAVKPEWRHTTVSCRLAASLIAALAEQGIERLVISGIASRKTLYEHAGFHVAGPPVRDGAAEFYPMIADLESLRERSLATRLHFHDLI